ncbi:MAG: GNAT family N-acetyltransferase [Actinobacteria bacterium]|nr:MAG: GNAT family N-acetyltransferase [Actinomycetota bacterium]
MAAARVPEEDAPRTLVSPRRGGVPEVQILAMRRRHLRSVLRIEAQVYPRPWSLSLFMSELALRSTRAYHVARAQGTVVGYSGLMFSGADAHVTTIAVDPAWQRHKVGTRLMLNMAWLARRRGALLPVRVPARWHPQELLHRDQRGRPGHVGRRHRHRRLRRSARRPGGAAGVDGGPRPAPVTR